MTTTHPRTKVTTYVPQALKDRLKEFRNECGNISESQAVATILAEYFQIPEVLTRSPEPTSTEQTSNGRYNQLTMFDD